ncbi:hypothetical protein [uncultured Bacteroides sp.]|uniref:hypothetical protein n=1 Tax=uncultured Bacteroides sp. TaxID=162156 RepID=UPI00266FCFAC|nr:hypothetical protein [uncultured Bacteroides sp.]
MNNREIIRLLEKSGYRRLSIDKHRLDDERTYFLYRRGLHITATCNLSFHIDPEAGKAGMCEFGICVVNDNRGYSRDIYNGQTFYSELFAFLKGEKSEEDFIREYAAIP